MLRVEIDKAATELRAAYERLNGLHHEARESGNWRVVELEELGMGLGSVYDGLPRFQRVTRGETAFHSCVDTALMMLSDAGTGLNDGGLLSFAPDSSFPEDFQALADCCGASPVQFLARIVTVLRAKETMEKVVAEPDPAGLDSELVRFAERNETTRECLLQHVRAQMRYKAEGGLYGKPVGLSAPDGEKEHD